MLNKFQLFFSLVISVNTKKSRVFAFVWSVSDRCLVDALCFTAYGNNKIIESVYEKGREILLDWIVDFVKSDD